MSLIQRIDAALKQSGNEALAAELKDTVTQLCSLIKQLQELHSRKDQLVRELCAAYELQLHKAAKELMTPKELRDAAWRRRFYRTWGETARRNTGPRFATTSRSLPPR